MPQSVIFCVKGLLNEPFAEYVSHLANLAGPLPELGWPPLIQASGDPSQSVNKPGSFDGCLDGGRYINRPTKPTLKELSSFHKEHVLGIDACRSLINAELLLGDVSF